MLLCCKNSSSLCHCILPLPKRFHLSDLLFPGYWILLLQSWGAGQMATERDKALPVGFASASVKSTHEAGKAFATTSVTKHHGGAFPSESGRQPGMRMRVHVCACTNQMQSNPGSAQVCFMSLSIPGDGPAPRAALTSVWVAQESPSLCGGGGEQERREK